jgi:hypothetical protein
MPTQLTEHFTLEEFTASTTALTHGIDNTPSGEAIDELTGLAEIMEDVRELLHGAPILITSGYRSTALNCHPAVGGVPDSAHCFGRAVDFIAPAFGTPRDICLKLMAHMHDLEIDQLIHESVGGYEWVHLGLSAPDAEPRRQALRIDGSGTSSLA